MVRRAQKYERAMSVVFEVGRYYCTFYFWQLSSLGVFPPSFFDLEGDEIEPRRQEKRGKEGKGRENSLVYHHHKYTFMFP